MTVYVHKDRGQSGLLFGRTPRPDPRLVSRPTLRMSCTPSLSGAVCSPTCSSGYADRTAARVGFRPL
jgi:hypothetical protein